MADWRSGVQAALFTALGALLTSAYVLFRSRRKADPRRQPMTLYYYPQGRSTRCVWLIEELGAQNDVAYVYVNIHESSAAVDQYRQRVHPHATSPALEIPGKAPILESAAICLYLADLYGDLSPPLEDRAQYYNWVVYAACSLDDTLWKLFVQWTYTVPSDQDNDLIERSVERFRIGARTLTAVLENQDFLCGNSLTAADCVLGYCVWWANFMKDGLLLEGFPTLKKYLVRLESRPAFARALSLK